MAMDRTPELLERISALETENKAIRKQLDSLQEQQSEAEHELAPAFNELSLAGPHAASTELNTTQRGDERALDLLGTLLASYHSVVMMLCFLEAYEVYRRGGEVHTRAALAADLPSHRALP